MSHTCWGIVTIILVGCHAPVLQHWESLPITGTVEALASAQAAPAVEARFGGVVRDTSVERRMKLVGYRLTKRLSKLRNNYQYRLLDSDRLNAVSLPAGYVYITRGLYERLSSNDLLAATLAHEIAHIVRRDHFKPVPRGSDQALDKELSADSYAAKLLDEAGYNTSALIKLILLVKEAQPDGWAETRAASLMHQLSDSSNLTTHVSIK